MDYDTGDFILFVPTIVRTEAGDVERKQPCGEEKRRFRKCDYIAINFQNVIIARSLPQKAAASKPDESLQKFFKAESGVLDKDLYDEDLENWDQFLENEKRFNVKTTFDEELYTTRLDKNLLTSQQIKKAERISKEIQRLPASNCHLQEDRGHIIEADEEKAYSAVIGTGKYKEEEGTIEGDELQMPKIETSPDAIEEPEEDSVNLLKPRAEPKRQSSRRNPYNRSGQHRNSLDCLGIDSTLMMDPETHREMLKYKQLKKTMQTVQHMKSLVYRAYYLFPSHHTKYTRPK